MEFKVPFSSDALSVIFEVVINCNVRYVCQGSRRENKPWFKIRYILQQGNGIVVFTQLTVDVSWESGASCKIEIKLIWFPVT